MGLGFRAQSVGPGPLARHKCRWASSSLVCISWQVNDVYGLRDISAYGLAGHECIVPGRSLVEMSWWVTSKHGLADRECILAGRS